MALKFSGDRELVLRCYEAHGTEAQLNLQSDLNLQLAKITNGLEVEDRELQPNDKIEPYKIKTFKLNFDG
jgi:alpha-mannosidase